MYNEILNRNRIRLEARNVQFVLLVKKMEQIDFRDKIKIVTMAV